MKRGHTRPYARLAILTAAALLFALFSVPFASGASQVSGDLPGGDTVQQRVPETTRTSIDLTAAPLLEPGLTGLEVLEQHPELVAEIAARTGQTIESVTDLLKDPTTHVTRHGILYAVEPVPDLSRASSTEASPVPLFAFSETFALSSLPGSPRTIHLDFDGHTVANTQWHQVFQSLPNPYNAPPFSIDGNPAFSDTELAIIQNVWARVAEDYAPFNVNVTTQDPGVDAIRRTDANDLVYGTRIVLTPSGFVGAGGVAFIGAFNLFPAPFHDAHQPAWCFTGNLAPGDSLHAKYIAECASHEVGHNLGLHHDGITDTSYYGGHSPWAPIMGVGYGQPVSQWSKGEYAGATETEDDFAVMASYGAPLRADDHSNNPASATVLGATATGITSSATDFDTFKYVAPATTTATFTANPAAISPNLDVEMRLYAANGSTLLASNNPAVARVSTDVAAGLNATISFAVTQGETYFIQLTGVGHLTASTGYTDYGSVGAYTLTASPGGGTTPPQAGETAGAVDPATGLWRLFDQTGAVAHSFYFGLPGDIPFMGDWDGDGIDTPGLYRQSTGFAYIRYTNTQGAADISFHFGAPGDVPIVGDWNGDGKDTLSVYRPSTGQAFIVNVLPPNGGALVAELSYYFGNPGDKPFAGDFDGDGIDTLGLHRESTGLVYFRNSHTQGAAHNQYFFGIPNDRLIAGDWGLVDGIDTPAVFRPGLLTWYFRHSNTQGFADFQFVQGAAGWLPVAGNFGLAK